MLLKKLVPINLIEEKKKFLADTSYNPQFIYNSSFSEEQLHKYGTPEESFADLAQSILDEVTAHRNEADLRMNQGEILSQKEVTEMATNFLQMHNLDEKIKIVWSKSFLSRASITSDSLKLRTGAEFRKENMLGMLYHEIGTHAIRRYNYEQQPWFKRKRKYGFSSYLMTEEGLASLHSLLPQTYKSAYNTATRYIACQFAQSHSFSEVWQLLESYIDDVETRWMVTVRQKRGISDTSQGGGFTKDIVYFEGMVKVYDWLRQNDFDLYHLYFGKLSTKDVDLAIELNPDFKPLLPSFYSLDKEAYSKSITEIGQENHFDEFLNNL